MLKIIFHRLNSFIITSKANKGEVKFSLLPVLALLLFINAFYSTWDRSNGMAALDFFHYWAIPQVLKTRPIQNIYSHEGRVIIAQNMVERAQLKETDEYQRVVTIASIKLDKGEIETIATPFLYWMFSALSTGYYKFDQQLFQFISLALFSLSVFVLLRFLSYSVVISLVVLSLLLAYFQPLISDVDVGNINRLQLALITGAIAFLSKPNRSLRCAFSGFIMGIAVMLKPNMVIPVALLIFSCFINPKIARAKAVITGFSLALIGAVFVSSLWFNSPVCWLQWLNILSDVLSSSRTLKEGNISIAHFVFHQYGFYSLPLLAVAGLLLLYAVWRGKHSDTTVRREEMVNINNGSVKPDLCQAIAIFSFGLALMLVFMQLVWLHYFLLIIPLIFFSLRPSGIIGRRWLEHSSVRLLLYLPLIVLTTIVFNSHASFETARLFLLIFSIIFPLIYVMSEVWHNTTNCNVESAKFNYQEGAK